MVNLDPKNVLGSVEMFPDQCEQVWQEAKNLEFPEDFKNIQNVVSKNNVSFDEYKPTGSTKLSQVLNVLSFGGYLTYDLAMLYGQDPSVIPWVNYFKRELEK